MLSAGTTQPISLTDGSSGRLRQHRQHGDSLARHAQQVGPAMPRLQAPSRQLHMQQLQGCLWVAAAEGGQQLQRVAELLQGSCRVRGHGVSGFSAAGRRVLDERQRLCGWVERGGRGGRAGQGPGQRP